MISKNLTSLNGKSVRDYNAKTGVQNVDSVIYRLRVTYDSANEGVNVPDLLRQFCADSNAVNVEELIIGAFDFEGGDSQDVVDALVECASKLPQLSVLFIGDITYEENEISWINQSDVGPVLHAYPGLEYFRVRGGNGLSLGKVLQHNKLKFLIVESGGLPSNVIEQVSQASLPNLEHLELWLGSDNYGFESKAEDFRAILTGDKFPRLRYLGLRDSEIADDLAVALQNAGVLNKIESLDLSMGTLTDEGAKALINNPAIKKLKMLDLHHHFMSEEVSKQFSQLGITVNVDDRQESDDGYRYVQVAE
ncbi:STM4015 family protein [Chryseolinea sp. T2]|uniref:STM4015 family protein n=1 Tax=Chryseolinea sp. T2 TaxID=3129255 RepID=UPI003077C92E